MSLERRLLRIGLIFVAVITFGAIGFALIEGWTWIDAFYMAVITVTTVGFAEVHPLSQAGKLFTSVLILLGVGAITYAFTALTNYVIAGELGDVLKGIRMKRQIQSIRDHYIVCGFGRVGQQVCSQLSQEGHTVLVVDNNPGTVREAKERGYPVVQGNAGDDEVLLEAGIMRAKGLVTAVESDASNLYVVLSARTFRRDLQIVARADSEEPIEKLQRAGADHVLSPYSLGGRLMAQTLLRPNVVDFLEAVMYDTTQHYFMEDFVIGPGCPLEGQTIGEAQVRERIGVTILGLKRGEDFVVPTTTSTQLFEGDVLMALGSRQQLNHLAQLVAPPPSH
ncbi:MAG: potassium channel protein [Anaerolineae bacterium]|jgi:voltage-gated potassium channel